MQNSGSIVQITTIFTKIATFYQYPFIINNGKRNKWFLDPLNNLCTIQNEKYLLRIEFFIFRNTELVCEYCFYIFLRFVSYRNLISIENVFSFCASAINIITENLPKIYCNFILVIFFCYIPRILLCSFLHCF